MSEATLKDNTAKAMRYPLMSDMYHLFWSIHSDRLSNGEILPAYNVKFQKNLVEFGEDQGTIQTGRLEEFSIEKRSNLSWDPINPIEHFAEGIYLSIMNSFISIFGRPKNKKNPKREEVGYYQGFPKIDYLKYCSLIDSACNLESKINKLNIEFEGFSKDVNIQTARALRLGCLMTSSIYALGSSKKRGRDLALITSKIDLDNFNEFSKNIGFPFGEKLTIDKRIICLKEMRPSDLIQYGFRSTPGCPAGLKPSKEIREKLKEAEMPYTQTMIAGLADQMHDLYQREFYPWFTKLSVEEKKEKIAPEFLELFE